MNMRMIGYSAIAAGSLILSGCSNNKGYTIIEEPIPDSLLVCDEPFPVEAAAEFPTVSKPYTVDSAPKVLNEAWKSVMEKEGYKVKLNQNFFQQVIDYSKKTKIDPVDLTFIMFQESKFNPSQKSAGGYVGLIQMDKNSFQNCALKMMEYEKHKKNHPDEKITLREYIDISQEKGFNKPDIGKDKISFEQYTKLSPEKQFKYAKAYLSYRIHEKGLNGKNIPSNQLWALIHRPTDYNKSSELNTRARLLNAVKNGGTVGGVKVKGVKEISPVDFRRIMRFAR